MRSNHHRWLPTGSSPGAAACEKCGVERTFSRNGIPQGCDNGRGAEWQRRGISGEWQRDRIRCLEDDRPPPPTLSEACKVIEALLAMCDLPENSAERKIIMDAVAFLARVKP